MICGQRFYQVVSLVLLARLAPSVAIQLDKFCCMFDYNFKNNPPYNIWQEKKKYPPGYWLKTNSILTEITYYPVPHLIWYETCPL
jgi:hypothetical protein